MTRNSISQSLNVTTHNITTSTFVLPGKACLLLSTLLKWYLLRRHMLCLFLFSQRQLRLSSPGLRYLETFDLESSMKVSFRLQPREDWSFLRQISPMRLYVIITALEYVGQIAVLSDRITSSTLNIYTYLYPWIRFNNTTQILFQHRLIKCIQVLCYNSVLLQLLRIFFYRLYMKKAKLIMESIFQLSLIFDYTSIYPNHTYYDCYLRFEILRVICFCLLVQLPSLIRFQFLDISMQVFH